jgi:hypothetical protein
MGRKTERRLQKSLKECEIKSERKKQYRDTGTISAKIARKERKIAGKKNTKKYKMGDISK